MLPARRQLFALLSLVVLVGASATGQVPGGGARAGLQSGVNAAIERGVAFLLLEQNRDGSWGPVEGYRQEAHFDRPSGQAALSVYTLLKCGLTTEHPAVQRGLAYLLARVPNRTYSIACQMMALSATGDSAHTDRMEELLELLLERSNRSGKRLDWGYPGGGHGDRPDLSNTQYGVLGLRAAAQSGLDIPVKHWREVVEGVLPYQLEPERFEHPERGRIDLAPFRYDRGGSHGGESASMTAVGIAVLSLCEEALRDTSARKTLRTIEERRAPALAWLEQNFSVEQNFGGDARWLYYYLYALERVGSLLEVERLAGHDWYAEGARVLLEKQGADGSWRSSGLSEWPPSPLTRANTCFALLFLSRATALHPDSGSGASAPGAIRAEDPEAEVWLRGTSTEELRVWLSGFGTSAESAARADGLRVLDVEWRIDGEVVAALPGAPDAAWANERYPLRWTLPHNGEYALEALVRVDGPDGVRVLSSGVVTVTALEVLEPWMLEYAEASGRAPLVGPRDAVTGSSELSRYFAAGQATDGLELSAWIAAADDPRPTLTIELKKPFTARAIRLSQVNANPGERGRYARAQRVEILINKSREPLVLELELDELRKSELVLPRATKVRTLQIAIVSWGSRSDSSSTGLAEVELVPK